MYPLTTVREIDHQYLKGLDGSTKGDSKQACIFTIIDDKYDEFIQFFKVRGTGTARPGSLITGK